MSEITVTTQQQLDNLPRDYHGRIYIRFGTQYDKAVVRRKYDFASIVACGNSSVEAYGNSSVEAWDNSSVVAWKHSYVVALGNSSVEAWGNSSVVARENSSVVARDNSSVEAWDNSSVVARDNSSVVARDNSSVEAFGNSQINQKSDTSKIKTYGNARIVRDPCSIDEYVNFYGIENSNGKAKLFKAVRKRDRLYRSDWDSDFVYTIGKSVVADGFCTDPNEDCGHGIHMAYLNWCLAYGSFWPDLAILEVEVDMSTVVVPRHGSGQVRAPSCKVIREVPLEECGLYGKMIANKRKDKV